MVNSIQSHKNLKNSIKQYNMHVIGVLEKKDRGQEKHVEIMCGNLPNKIENINLKNQIFTETLAMSP